MLPREHLQKFVHQRCHTIDKHLNGFCTTLNPEALHGLRVEIKKLKAFVRLLQAAIHGQSVHIKPIKELYTRAGTLRTAQINLEILQSLQLEHETFRSEQKRIIAEESALFCHNLTRYRKKLQQAETCLQEHARNIKTPTIKALFKEGVGKLALFFQGPELETGALHGARKEVKDLMYIHALLPTALATTLGINSAYLHQLQTCIGAWHDNEVTLSLVRGSGPLDATLTGALEKANTTLLQDIEVFTAGFDRKILAGTDPPATNV